MKKLILASQSPRRYELLKAAGYDFQVMSVEVEEIYPDTLTDPSQIAIHLAELKSRTAQSVIESNAVVLTSDTIVVLDDVILGKPSDRNEAIVTLQHLSNRSHKVITAVAMAQKGSIISAFDLSTVHFNSLSRAEIEFYVDTCNPLDKAGSYGIQDWLGLCKVAKIEGSHSNIMGLPMQLTFKMLSETGIYPVGLQPSI